MQKIAKAPNKEFVIKQAEIFDNATKRVIVPASAITVILSENEEVCFLFDINGTFEPFALLEEAYIQLLHLLHTTADEAKEKFKEINKDAEILFHDKHAVFIGWINGLFKEYIPEELLLIIRQGLITGVCLPLAIPADLTFTLNELLKYGELTHYYIGAYEQVFIIEREDILWEFLYSDVNKYPPTLFKNVCFEDNKMNYDMIYNYDKDGEIKKHLPGFFKDVFRGKIKKKGKKPFPALKNCEQ